MDGGMDSLVSTTSPDRRCPACGRHGKPRGRKDGFTMLICTRCRTLYTAQIPPPFAGCDYSESYTTADTAIVSEFIRGQVRNIVSGFATYRQTNRLLDLGFGSAVFMQEAEAECWDVSGVEVSKSAVQNAKRLGFQNIFQGNLASADYPSGHFDVVVASEVVEHVVDLRSLLAEVVRVLRPNGLFWASTPHARGLSFRLLGLDWSVVIPPAHLQLFSVAGMRTLLEAAGFRRIHLATHGFNPYEVRHAWKRRARAGTGTVASCGSPVDTRVAPTTFDRVTTSRQLNEELMRTPLRRACKQFLNASLSASRLGDRLKIYAVR